MQDGTRIDAVSRLHGRPPTYIHAEVCDYNTWRGVVHHFSDRNLTEASDRLPALSGLAQRCGEVLKEDYFAGTYFRCMSW